MRPINLSVGISLLSALAGCGTAGPANPSFDTDVAGARAALRRMADEPRPLDRPVVILGGFNDVGVGAWGVQRRLRQLTGDRRVVTVSFPFCFSFDDCRRRVIAAVDKAFPTDDPTFTTEVDVVGISMGGLVARYVAAPAADPNARRLRIARLFTVSSPHRGATMADAPLALSSLHRDMRRGSPFLRKLEQAERAAAAPADGDGAYELHPYVRLGDWIVGEANAAPAGRTPRWVPTPPLQDSHLQSSQDPRILADIARRLRGEEPLANDPPAPLPRRAAADHNPGPARDAASG